MPTTVYTGTGGVQYGMEMGEWEVRLIEQRLDVFHPDDPGGVVRDVRCRYDVASHLIHHPPIGTRLPWLVFGGAVVTRPVVESVTIEADQDAVLSMHVEAVGGALCNYQDEPAWHRHPELQALAADHFRRLGRGDSIAHLLADWFDENGYPDMADVCRAC